MLRKAARCEPPVSAAIRQLCAARLASGIDAACKAAATALRPAAKVGASTQAEVLQDNPGLTCSDVVHLLGHWQQTSSIFLYLLAREANAASAYALSSTS